MYLELMISADLILCQAVDLLQGGHCGLHQLRQAIHQRIHQIKLILAQTSELMEKL